MEHQYQYPIVKEILTPQAPVDRDTFLDNTGLEKPKTAPGLIMRALGAVAVRLSKVASIN